MLSLLFALSFSKLQLLREEKNFVSWMRTNNRYFTGDEYHFRLGLYTANSRYIQEFNKNHHSFKLGHNRFSCYTPSEYQSILGNRMDPNAKRVEAPKDLKKDVNAPESLDYRDQNVVNQIKDQAQCGSCWAFSAVTTSESAYALSKGTLLSYSEQNIVDCDNSCYGCSGGNPSYAIDYVISNQGGKFNSEDDYPYEAVDGTCRFDKSKGIGLVSSYVSVFFHSEIDLLNKVATYGVASVAIDASLSSFTYYTSGIYDDSDCSSWFLDHAVAVVGYGSENGTDYWIVRNSWGTSWGEQGYIRMLRGSFTNLCGIASQALVATV